MGRTLDEALQHAMEAAGEWAQVVSLPRPRLLEACDVCGVDVQLTRLRSEPAIVRQAIEITGSTEPPLFVTDVRKALAQGTRRVTWSWLGC